MSWTHCIIGWLHNLHVNQMLTKGQAGKCANLKHTHTHMPVAVRLYMMYINHHSNCSEPIFWWAVYSPRKDCSWKCIQLPVCGDGKLWNIFPGFCYYYHHHHYNYYCYFLFCTQGFAYSKKAPYHLATEDLYPLEHVCACFLWWCWGFNPGPDRASQTL